MVLKLLAARALTEIKLHYGWLLGVKQQQDEESKKHKGVEGKGRSKANSAKMKFRFLSLCKETALYKPELQEWCLIHETNCKTCISLGASAFKNYIYKCNF